GRIFQSVFYSFVWLPIVLSILGIALPLILWVIFGFWFVGLTLKLFGLWESFGDGLDKFLKPHKLLSALVGIAVFAASLLALFYLYTEDLPFSWGAAVFISALILVPILLLKPELFRNDWLGAIVFIEGVFYFVLPSAGWMLTGFIVEDNWRKIYAARVFLSVVVPICASILILIFRVRRAAFLQKISMPLLMLILPMITALPMWSAYNTMLDLYVGAQKQIIKHNCSRDEINETCACGGKEILCFDMQKDEEILTLPHTQKVFQIKPFEDEKPPNLEAMPESAVKGFYILYLSSLDSRNELRTDSVTLSFLSERLRNWYLSKAERNYTADYFLDADANDWNENWRIKKHIDKAVINAGAATVKVTLSNESSNRIQNLQVGLVKENDEWKIDSVKGLEK
ncbi:MAG: DUF3828 domain-containing protein, partial [Pyrinomonadaceae bacterium]